MRYFDSLVHVTEDGSWLGSDRYDSGLDRLQAAMDRVEPARACLVAIAGWIDNDIVTAVHRDHPERYVPVGGYDPGRAEDTAAAEQAIADLAGKGFAGVKLPPRLTGYDPLDERAVAAMPAAGRHDVVVFIDTLFRQRAVATRRVDDVVDIIARECPDTRFVLLHGGGSALLDLFELARMHPHLIVDVSFTIMRYARSSVDADIRFMVQNLDQRMSLGSDFPEYTPAEALARFAVLTEGLPERKRENVAWRNLAALFGPDG